MAEGLQVLNDNNILSIDGTYKNLCLYKVGLIKDLERKTVGIPYYDINHVSKQGYQGLFTGYLPASMRYPMVAVQLNTTQYTTVFSTFKKSDGTWEFSIYVGRGVNSSSSTSDFNIKYFVFDDPALTSSTPSGYGLQVFDADESLVFDAVKKYMKVVNYVPISLYEDGGVFPRVVTTITVPPSKTIALMSSSRSGDVEFGYRVDDDFGAVYQDSEQFAVNQLTADNKLALYQDEWVETYGAATGYRTYKYRNTGGLLLDVTGY